MAGFSDQGDSMMMEDYNKPRLDQVNKAIEDFVQSLGAQVRIKSDFDPFKASVSSTAGLSNVQIVQSIDGKSTVAKSKLELQNEEMARIKKARIDAYEGRLEDREIEVYNHDSKIKLEQQKRAQEFWESKQQEEAKESTDQMMQIDTTTQGQEPQKPQDDDDRRIERNAAIRLIQENKKREAFRDKRQI